MKNAISNLRLNAILLFVFCSTLLYAQVTWDGGGDGMSWGDADNWVGDVLPMASDSVVIDADAKVVVNGSYSARGIRVGGGDTLVHANQLALTTGITVQSNGVFIWSHQDLEWPDIINYGTIRVVSGGTKYLRSDVHITNMASGTILFLDGQTIYFHACILENYGEISLEGSVDLLTTASGTRKIVNRASGTVLRLAGAESQTTIQPEFENHGVLEVEVGSMEFTGVTYLKDGNQLVTNDTSEITFEGSVLYMEGVTSGDASGDIILDCNVEPNGATIDFSEDGFQWYRDRIIGGDTLTNLGVFHVIFGSSKYFDDSTVLVNNGTMLFDDNADIYFNNGVLVNENTIEFGSSSDFIKNAGGHWKIINQSGATITKKSTGTATIHIDLINNGTLRADEGALDLSGLKYLFDGSQLVTNDTTEILFDGDNLQMVGATSGNASGDIIIDCNLEPIGATINFLEDGFQWYRNRISGGDTLTNLGVFHVIFGSYKYLNDSTVLVNKATILFDDNADIYFNHGVLVNQNTIELGNSSDFIKNVGGHWKVFNQSGASIVKKSTGTSTIHVDLINSGTLRADEGALDLSGLKYLYDGSSLVTNDTTEILFDGDNLQMVGATSGNASGDIIIDCNIEPVGATINFSEDGFQWYRDRMIGGDTLTNLGEFQVIFGSYKYLDNGTVLANDGTLTFHSNADVWFNQGSIINTEDLILNQDNDFYDNSGAGNLKQIINSQGGTVTKVSSGISNINVDFRNDGQIEVDEGQLNLNTAKWINDGSQINVMSGANLKFLSGLLTFSGVSSGQIDGAMTIDCGFTSVDGIVNYTGNGITWFRNTFEGNGTLKNDGLFSVIFGSYKYMTDSATLWNNGLLQFEASADIWMQSASRIVNSDSIIMDGASILYQHTGTQQYVKNEAGAHWIKTDVGGQTTIGCPFENNGKLRVIDNTLIFNNDLFNTQSGKFSGTGTIDLPSTSHTVTNDGTTSPGLSPGTLSFVGSFVMSDTAILEIELNGTTPGIDYDVVASSVAASVSGSIDLTVGFLPTVGEQFDIVTAPSFSLCDFQDDTISACYNDEILLFEVQCLTTSVRLEYLGLDMPVLVCQPDTVFLNAAGAATLDPNQFFSDTIEDCGFDALSLNFTSVDCSDVGQQSITLTAGTWAGNISCMTTVTTLDTIKPTAICKSNPTFYLSNSGNLILTPADIDNGSNDACGITRGIDKTNFNCGDVGNHVVTLTVTDPSGNQDMCQTTISVQDATPPDAQVQDITVTLHAINGTAGITPAMIDNGTTDNCGIQSLTLSQTNFNCTHVGVNSVTFTATDVNGNQSQQMADVTVQENTPPVVMTQDVTITLHPVNGTATLTPAMVNNGSMDNCGIQGLSLSQTNFNCSHVGTSSVTLTVTDVNGNQAQGTANVTVQDNAPPVVMTQDVTITLHPVNGNASITPAMVYNGSTDNCGIQGLSLSQTNFNCSHVGTSSVTLTVTDVNGNQAQAMANVTVQDNAPPVVMTQDVTITLHPVNGTATLTPAMVNNGSTDNCGIQGLSLSQTSFNCIQVGTSSVTLTVTDVNGNQAQGTANVTVQDNTPPVALLQDVTVTLNVPSGTANLSSAAVDNGSTDNCGIATIDLSQTVFTCSDSDVTTIAVTLTDVNGNQTVDNVDVTLTKPQLNEAWVSESATGNGNGLSKTHAFKTIPEALTATGCIEDVELIHLVEGTYLPEINGMNARLSTFEIDSKLTILGGYPVGAGARNPAAYESVLSGDIGVPNDKTDNAYHVVTVTSPTDTVTLDGVKVEKGNANGPMHMNGGGLSISGVVLLVNSTVRDCAAANEGAGVHISAPNGNLILDSSEILGSSGGGSNMYSESGGQLLIHNDSQIDN